MTSHRLVRCPAATLLGHTREVHAATLAVGADLGRLPHWRNRPPHSDTVTAWHSRLPDGSVLGWCLEVEQGANGILAHLSTALVSGRASRLPPPVQRLALLAWSERELAGLARAVESARVPVRRLPAPRAPATGTGWEAGQPTRPPEPFRRRGTGYADR